MRQAFRIAAAVAVFSVSGAVVVGASHEAAAETCASKSLVGNGSITTGWVPVLFVHGMVGSPANWEKPELNGSASIATRIRQLYGATVWEFDYQKTGLDWVTDPTIGPALATAISCLARVSGKRVVLVDHSMGGLATQYAAAQPDGGGGGVASHIAEVVTIGTPFQGSKLLRALQTAVTGGEVLDPAMAVVTEAILSSCAGLGESGLKADIGNPCSLVAVARSPLGKALEFKSAAISKLPAWPGSVLVKNLAGEIKIKVGIWKLRHTFDVGDLPVSQDSATAHNTDGSPDRFSCDDTVLQLITSKCYHGKLLRNPDVVNDVVSIVQKILNAEGPSRPAPPPPAPPTATAPPPPPPPQTVPQGFSRGGTFDDTCSLAGPPPDRGANGISAYMQCVHLPPQYQFVDVSYSDPNFQINSGEVVEVHGQVADIVKNGGFGFLVVVVEADRITFVNR